MTGTDEGRRRLARRCNERLLEYDTFVSRRDGFANADKAVPILDRRRYVAQFVATGFPLSGAPTELPKSFQKERLDVMRLETSCIRALHILMDAKDAARVHGIV